MFSLESEEPIHRFPMRQPATVVWHSGTGACGYMAHLFNIYQNVMACGCPNFARVCIQLPSNVVFKECSTLVHAPEDAHTVQFLRFGFSEGYEGPMPTPASANHHSANTHLQTPSPPGIKRIVLGTGSSWTALGHIYQPRVSMELHQRTRFGAGLRRCTFHQYKTRPASSRWRAG